MSQAFAAAGRAFGMRQPQGRCLIVPYGAQGQILAEKLLATEQPEDAIRLMHQAQRYLLPVTSRVWERLMAQGALRENPAAGATLLDAAYYDWEDGLLAELEDEEGEKGLGNG